METDYGLTDNTTVCMGTKKQLSMTKNCTVLQSYHCAIYIVFMWCVCGNVLFRKEAKKAWLACSQASKQKDKHREWFRKPSPG